MKVPDPFRWLGDDGQWRLFLLVSILSIAVMVALDDQGSQLKTEASPWGIVSLEFAGSGEAATRMLAEWGERGRLIAGINLGLDFLFILFYAVALSLGSAIAARSHGRFSTSRERLGYLIAWGALLAGLFPGCAALPFQPSIPHLVYQYNTFSTARPPPASLAGKNPEIPE